MPCPSIVQNDLGWSKLFWTVQIILDRYKLFGHVQFFLPCPKHFGQVQIRLFFTNFYNLDLSKMILTGPKQIGLVQNNWYSTKMIWTVQIIWDPKKDKA